MNFQELLPDLEPALRSLATSELVMAIKASSWAMPSITKRMGAAACGPTAALASGTKISAPPNPEKPRASEAMNAAAMSGRMARVEWWASNSLIT